MVNLEYTYFAYLEVKDRDDIFVFDRTSSAARDACFIDIDIYMVINTMLDRGRRYNRTGCRINDTLALTNNQ